MATKDISDAQVVLAYLESRQRPERQADAPLGLVALKLDEGEGYPWPYVILEQRTGQCFKVCYRAMERAHRRGLIEYGTSLRSGWVTEQGMEFLAEELKHRRLNGDQPVMCFLDELTDDTRQAMEIALKLPPGTLEAPHAG